MSNFRIQHHPIEYNPHSIIAIGCSCTYGTGVEAHEAWPAQLELIMGMPVYNFGVPGGSLDTCFRVLNTFLPIIQSKTIVMNKPSVNRREIIDSGMYIQIGHWSKEHLDLLDPLEIALNTSRQLYAIEGITNRYNSRVIIADTDDTDYPSPLTNGLGTDRLHPGPQWHIKMAELFRKRI